MKRMLLSLLVVAVVALVAVPAEAQACGGRFRSRVRAVVTAPVRLVKAVCVRRGNCCPHYPCGTSCPAH